MDENILIYKYFYKCTTNQNFMKNSQLKLTNFCEYL